MLALNQLFSVEALYCAQLNRQVPVQASIFSLNSPSLSGELAFILQVLSHTEPSYPQAH